ncbi:MAG: SDR family NAD(P)-dependent oxidoreductase [Candidatus Aminicenantes bacterium]|nr:SDR family NAD(P)-dependent oxidoreductase [Candidatus Aminicenantes bacterium]
MNSKIFFRDKVVIITGASSGIGREAALFFAQLQAKVVLAARNREKLAAVQEEIRRQGGQALALGTDVCSFADMQRMARETVLKWGKIDILIANAGEYVQDLSRGIDIGSIERSMAVNFMGTVHAVKSVLPEMRRNHKGHIVIVNSLDAKKGIVNDGPYVAAKAALDGFGDVLRQELKADGINVTSIYPARVDTPMMENLKVPWISPKIAPVEVVKAMARGIKRNKAIVAVPAAYFLLGPLNIMFPRLADWAYRILKIEGEKIEKGN